jgi:hypothetical protein
MMAGLPDNTTRAGNRLAVERQAEAGHEQRAGGTTARGERDQRARQAIEGGSVHEIVLRTDAGAGGT